MINNRLTGEWLIIDIKFNYDISSGLTQVVTLVKRELELSDEELEKELNQPPKQKNGQGSNERGSFTNPVSTSSTTITTTNSELPIIKPKTYYPDKEDVVFTRTTILQSELAKYLSSEVSSGKISKYVAIATLAKSISEQGSGNTLRGFNNNFYGVQTDSGRWGLPYDNYIIGNVTVKENRTGKERSFAAFSDPYSGSNFVSGKVKDRGLYVTGTTTYITKGTYVSDVSSWARVYYKEWVIGDKDAEPDPTSLSDLIRIYNRAQTMIG